VLEADDTAKNDTTTEEVEGGGWRLKVEDDHNGPNARLG
jgi:hypothetical protein